MKAHPFICNLDSCVPLNKRTLPSVVQNYI